MTQEGLEDSPPYPTEPLFPDSAFDLVVIVSSADGVPTLKHLVQGLPASFPAPVAVVHHIGSRASFIADVLDARARLPVRFAQDGERLRAGCVRVAPADRHLVISQERRFALSDGEKVNHVRPAGDPLFASAAHAFGSRLLGVVLSGMGRDGVAGALEIKRAGGVVIAQDPASTIAPFMPQAAIDSGAADLVFDVPGIASALVSLVAVHGTRSWLGLPQPLRETGGAIHLRSLATPHGA